MTHIPEPVIHGFCAPRFGQVADQFRRNFTERSEIGAGVAVFVEGHLVVNLWGGWADPPHAQMPRPWGEDTLSTILSGSKAIVSTCIHQLAQAGEINLHTPICHYWPAFGQAGKDQISTAMILAHRAGVIGPNQPIHWRDVLDHDLVRTRLEQAHPWWPPGRYQGYHMTTFGFILNEIFSRVTGQSLAQYVRHSIAGPLEAQIYIGVPVDQQRRQCADPINKPTIREMLADAGAPKCPRSLTDHPKAGLAVAMGFVPDDEIATNDLERWRSEEFPGTNVQTSALGLARFYNALAQEHLLSRSYMDRIRVLQGGSDPDLVLGPRVAQHGWGLGYMLNAQGVNGPNRRIFGHGGLGGSFGFVDLDHHIGYAYVMNRFDHTQANADPRSTALSNEVYRALGVIPRDE